VEGGSKRSGIGQLAPNTLLVAEGENNLSLKESRNGGNKQNKNKRKEGHYSTDETWKKYCTKKKKSQRTRGRNGNLRADRSKKRRELLLKASVGGKPARIRGEMTLKKRKIKA